MNGLCGETLTGYVPGVTLICELRTDHHSAHEDGQLGKVIHWTANNIWSTGRVA